MAITVYTYITPMPGGVMFFMFGSIAVGLVH
jgi:hypothetical protein